jgi:energy-coupling factor transporter transmembrane protein EcfT
MSAAPIPLTKDPLARMITVGCFSFGLLGHTPLAYAAIVAGVYSCWMYAAGIPPTAFLAKLKGALLFLGVIILVNGVTESGRVLFAADGVYLTLEGLAKGTEQALRLSIVLWGAFLLTSTVRIEEFQDAAERLTTRRGRPLVAAGTIALTYLPLLVESSRRVTIARRARGEEDRPRFPGGIAHVAAAALPLFASAMRNADALAEAMESRCYDTRSARTPFRRLSAGPRDVMVVLAAVLITAAALTGIP